MHCGEPLLGARPNRKFCDMACKKAYHSQQWREQNPKSPLGALSMQATAELNVLRVCKDLLQRCSSIQLFRALFPAQDCDLIAMDWGIPATYWRIEVTSGNYTGAGNVTHPKRDARKYDVLAVVIGEEIVYQPPFGEWPMGWKRLVAAHDAASPRPAAQSYQQKGEASR